mgnify:CR=1 FL=1
MHIRHQHKNVFNILRKQDKYICGICQNSYNTQNSAIKCLIKCLYKILKTKPILQDYINKVYYCNICHKKYLKDQDALKCAYACFKKIRYMNIMNMYLISQLIKKQPKLSETITEQKYIKND